MASNKKHQQRMDEFQNDLQYEALKSNLNRARSITVGTAFGGVIEICMRTDSSTYYAQLQPIEAIEVIESLAAACGLQIAMRPRQDFASWRDWHIDESQVNVIWKGGSPWQTKAFEAAEQIQEQAKQYLRPEEREVVEEHPDEFKSVVEETLATGNENIELPDGTQITYSKEDE